MDLIKDLSESKKRRALTDGEMLQVKDFRRDLNNIIDGGSALDRIQGKDYSVTETLSGAAKTGVVGTIPQIGGMFQAIGHGLAEDPKEARLRQQWERSQLKEGPPDYPVDEFGQPLYTTTGQWDGTPVDPATYKYEPPAWLNPKATPEEIAKYKTEEQERLDQIYWDTALGRNIKEKHPERNLLTDYLIETGEGIAEYGDKIIKDNPQWQRPDFLKGRGVWKDVVWNENNDLSVGDRATLFLTAVLENAPQTGVSLTATAVGGILGGAPGAAAGAILGLSTTFALEAGEVYNTLKETRPDLTEADISTTALAHATISTALETLPIGFLLNKLPGVKNIYKKAVLKQLLKEPKLVKRVVTSAAVTGVVESLTEGLQEISANAAKDMYEGNYEKYFEGVPDAMILGLFMGGTIQSLSSVLTQKSVKQQWKEARLSQMDTEQLSSLMNDPGLMAKEDLTQEEVGQALVFSQAADRLRDTDRFLRESPDDIYNLAETEAEEAARLMTWATDPIRAKNVRDLKNKNLTDEQLVVLQQAPEMYADLGMKQEDVENILAERKQMRAEIIEFEKFLEGKSESYKKGVIDSLRGEYYNRTKTILEHQGKYPVKDIMQDIKEGVEIGTTTKKQTEIKKTAAEMTQTIKEKVEKGEEVSIEEIVSEREVPIVETKTEQPKTKKKVKQPEAKETELYEEVEVPEKVAEVKLTPKQRKIFSHFQNRLPEDQKGLETRLGNIDKTIDSLSKKGDSKYSLRQLKLALQQKQAIQDKLNKMVSPEQKQEPGVKPEWRTAQDEEVYNQAFTKLKRGSVKMQGAVRPFMQRHLDAVQSREIKTPQDLYMAEEQHKMTKDVKLSEQNQASIDDFISQLPQDNKALQKELTDINSYLVNTVTMTEGKKAGESILQDMKMAVEFRQAVRDKLQQLPKAARKGGVETVTPGKITRREVQKEVKRILKTIPSQVKVVDALPKEVAQRLTEGARAAKKKGQPRPIPIRMTSRLIDQFVDKANLSPKKQTAKAWLNLVDQWKKPKKKKGKEIPGSAQMPLPVQEELEFSGLEDYLRAIPEDTKVSTQQLKDMYDEYTAFNTKETLSGYVSVADEFFDNKAKMQEYQKRINELIESDEFSKKHFGDRFSDLEEFFNRYTLEEPQKLKTDPQGFLKYISQETWLAGEDIKAELRSLLKQVFVQKYVTPLRVTNPNLTQEIETKFSDMRLRGPKDKNYRIHHFMMPEVYSLKYYANIDGLSTGEVFDTKDEAEEAGAMLLEQQRLEGYEGKGDIEIGSLMAVNAHVQDNIHFPGHKNQFLHTRAVVKPLVDKEGTTLFLLELQSDTHRGPKRYLNKAKLDKIETMFLPKRRAVMNALEGVTLRPVREALIGIRQHVFNNEQINIDKTINVIKGLKPEQFAYHMWNTEVFTNYFDVSTLTTKQIKAIQDYTVQMLQEKKFSGIQPDLPLKNTWEQYALKKMVMQAVYEGHNYVTWAATPEQVQTIEHWPNITKIDDGYYVNMENLNPVELKSEINIHNKAITNSYKNPLDFTAYPAKEINQGKELFKNLTGVVDLYTTKMPNLVKRLFKKYGVKVEKMPVEVLKDIMGVDGLISTKAVTEDVFGFEITPELKEAILNGAMTFAAKKEGGPVQAVYDQGNMYFDTSNIDSVEDIKGLLTHEGGHYLRRNDKKFQKEYNGLVDQFLELAVGKGTDVDARAVQRAYDMALADPNAVRNGAVQEEALMYFLQDSSNQERSLWQKFVSLINKWLQRIGFTPKQLNMSGRDMADVIISDLRQHFKEQQAINDEADQIIEERTLAARDNKDITPLQEEAQNILNEVFYQPQNPQDAKKAMDAAELETLENLAEHSTNPEIKETAKLTAKIFNSYSNAQIWKRAPWEQTTTILERMLSKPEYIFMKDRTAKKILDKALDMSKLKYEWKKKIEGDFFPIVNKIRKKDAKSYEQAEKYLNTIDQTGEGFFMSGNKEGTKWNVYNSAGKKLTSKPFTDEKRAEQFMVESEQMQLKRQGFSDNALEVVKQVRELTNRGFDVAVADMRRQIELHKKQGLEEPTQPFVDDKGVQSEITMTEAIAKMGDLRGTYFPRQRPKKGHSLQARGEGLPNILETFNLVLEGNWLDEQDGTISKIKKFINMNSPMGRRITELEKKGYTKISVTPANDPANTIFDTPQLISSISAVINAANEKLNEKDLTETEIKALTNMSTEMSMRIADIYKTKGVYGSRKQRSKTVWEGYETDPVKAMAAYAQRIASGSASREAARDMIGLFTGREISWEQFKEANPDADYLDYRKHVVREAIHPKKQKELYNDLQTYMTFVLSPRSKMDSIIGVSKALAVWKFLGFRISSAIINTTNMFTGVPGTIIAHTNTGVAGALKYASVAGWKYLAYRIENAKKLRLIPDNVYKTLKKAANEYGTLTTEDRQLFDTISERGWDEPLFNQDATQALQDAPVKLFEGAMKAAMYMFGATEKANRAMTIFAAYQAHKDSRPQPTDVDSITREQELLLRLAQHTSNRAHGIYGKAAKPYIIQKYGTFWDLPYTFQSFQHNYMLNIAEIVGDKHKYKPTLSIDPSKSEQEKRREQTVKHQKQKAKAAAYLLLSPAAVAGLTASPVLAIMLGAWAMLTPDIDDPEDEIYAWVDEHFGEGEFASRLTRHGVAGAFGHTNLRGSIQMTLPTPTTLEELAGAPGALVTGMKDAYHYGMVHGEYSKALDALPILPVGLSAPFKAYREKTEGITTKSYMPVMYNEERLRGNAIDATLRSFSYNPSRLSAIRDKQWSAEKIRRAFRVESSTIRRRIRKHILFSAQDAEEWSEIMNEVDNFNDMVMRTPERYEVNMLSDKWVDRAIGDAYKHLD